MGSQNHREKQTSRKTEISGPMGSQSHRENNNKQTNISGSMIVDPNH